MQAKMIGKIPLRNDTKVLKIESRAEKETPSRDVKTVASSFHTGRLNITAFSLISLFLEPFEALFPQK